jgi:GTP-binding protein
MKPLQLKFFKSAAKFEQLTSDIGTEIVCIGYSNVGKSSIINRMCNQKNMAKTSRTPGRTQLFNIFEHSEQARLVDVPGYGYAKASPAEQHAWQDRLQHYLVNRKSLQAILLVCDIRRSPREIDQTIVAWSIKNQLPLIIALNKVDKLSKNQRQQQAQLYQKLHHEKDQVQAFLCSCLKGDGIGQLTQSVQAVLNKDYD